MLLSILWAKNYTDATYYLSNLIKLLLIAFILTNRVRCIDDLVKIIKLLVHSRMFCAIVLIAKTPYYHWGTMELGSAIGVWKNHLGLTFTLSTFLAMVLVVTEQKYKFLYIIETIIFATISVISGSRKAAGMVILGFIIFTFLKNKNRMTGKVIFRRLIQIFVVVVALFAFYSLMMTNEVLYNLLGSRVETMLYYMKFAQGDESMIERKFYIDVAWELFRNNPFFGVGSNGFVTYLTYIRYSHVAYSHNNFTEILCTLGLVGFVLYYSMPVYLAIKLFPANLPDGKTRKMVCVLWITEVLFLIFGWWFVYYFDIFINMAFIVPALLWQIYKNREINLIGVKERMEYDW